MRQVLIQTLLLLLPALAGAGGTGRVEGTVRSTNGTPLPGAVVSIEGTEIAATTDAAGRFALEGLTAGAAVTVVASFGQQPPQRIRAYVSAYSPTSIAFNFKVELPKAPPAPGPQGSAPAPKTIGRIEGVVRSADRKPLAGARVEIEGTSHVAESDSDGRFVFEDLETGRVVTLVASYASLPKEKSRVQIAAGTNAVAFTLQLATVTEEVLVETEIPLLNASDRISSVTLSPEQMGMLPSLAEKDIFRALQLLPGVSGSRESSSGLYVRGGTPSENLVAYDGFTVYHVDHLFGYFTAFNMDAVDQVHLSKAAFAARDGGRLSGVLDLVGKTGRRDRPGVTVSVSALSVHAVGEAPLGKDASLLLAGRRSFQGPLYNGIFDLVGNQGAGMGPGGGPRPPSGGGPGGRGFSLFETQPTSYFYDANAKLLWQPGPNDRLTLSLFRGRDTVDNSRSLEVPDFIRERMAADGMEPPDSFDMTDTRGQTNDGAGVTWNRSWGRGIEMRTSLGYSSFQDLNDRTSAAGSRGPGMGGAEDNDLADWTARWELAIPLRWNNALELGAVATQNEIGYSFDQTRGTQFRPGPRDDDAQDERPEFAGTLDRDTQAAQYSLYAQDRWTLWKRLTLAPGLRVTRYDGTRETYVEPRATANLALSERVRLKGAWGVQHQFANRLTREDVQGGNREFWTLADGTTVPVSRARQVALGVSYETRDFLVDVEAFHKRLDGLTFFSPQIGPPLPPPDTDADAESGDETESTDSAEESEDAPIDLGQFFYQGTGTARGIELLVQKKFGRHTGWLSYTLARAEYSFPTLDEKPFPASHDQTHELKLVDSVRLGRWTVSGTWIYATGRPYTEPTDIESTVIDDRFTFDRLILGERNALRLPDYHRLDLALHYAFPLGPTSATVGLSAFNVYSRDNVWYREFQTLQGEILQNDVLLMGRTLNVFGSVRF